MNPGGEENIESWQEILPGRLNPKLNADFLSSILIKPPKTMAALPTMRPLGCLKTLFRAQDAFQPQMTRRFISTAYSKRPERVPLPPNLPQQFLSQLPVRMQPQNGTCSLKSPTNYPLAFCTDCSRSFSFQIRQGLPCSSFHQQSMQRPRREDHRVPAGRP